MGNPLFAVAGKEVDNGNLNHRVAAGLQTGGGTCHTYQYLGGEGGVVDAHVELEALVLGGSTHALAHHVDTMAHVADSIHGRNGKHVGLIRGEVGVGSA